jgi:hypothetical protein
MTRKLVVHNVILNKPDGFELPQEISKLEED